MARVVSITRTTRGSAQRSLRIHPSELHVARTSNIVHTIPRLLDCWDEVSRRVQAADGIYLFLDFDGTLVEFRPRPDQVKLTEESRLALRKLTLHRDLHVAIVSGRRRATLMQYVKVPRIQFLGLYGWEHGERIHLPKKTTRKLSRVRDILADLPNDLPGIHIEDKFFTLAIHFRGASPQAQWRARRRILNGLARYRQDLRVIRANHSWEVVPSQVCGKGAAVRNALRTARPTLLPIYVGDDLTDEPAFAALRSGITVLVGPPRKTNARFSLGDSTEVCRFLGRLEEELA